MYLNVNEAKKALVSLGKNRKFEIATGFAVGLLLGNAIGRKTKKKGLPKDFEDDYRCMRIVTDAKAQQ